MTKLPRITISLPPDIEGAINAIRASPKFKRVPKAKIVCSLIRKGLKAESEHDADNGKSTTIGIRDSKEFRVAVTSGEDKA